MTRRRRETARGSAATSRPGRPRTSGSRRPRRLFAALLLVVAAGGAIAFLLLRPAPSASDLVGRRWAQGGVRQPNVVLITLDTTRADHVGCYGQGYARTPNIDALARAGGLFLQATSPAPLTLPAHASIMTGTYPTHHGVRVNGTAALSQAQETLAEVLSARGYATAAFVAAFVLDGRWGLNQGFQLYDDRFDLHKYKHLDLGTVQRPGNEVMDAALPWLEAHKRAPFFAWIHLYDPHSPYEPPEPFRSEYGGRGPLGLYDGEIAFADQQVGRVVEWLRTNGLDERTVLVVMGDHGEGLGSHGEGTHGYFVYDSTVRVPLVVAAPFPELRGVRVDSQVSSVDVFPTVLALCGMKPGPKVQGRSLLPLLLHPADAVPGYAYAESMTPSLQFGWSPLEALRSGRYKLVKAPRPELYDLSADPDETTNVYARRPLVADELTRRLDRLVADTSRGATAPEAADLDKETAEKLAALGYVGAPAAARADANKPLADPKDKLAVFSAVQQAGELIVKDEYAGAARALESALREEPRMPQALLMLGTAYSELGRRREAKAQFDAVLQDDPRNVQALIGVANLLVEEGRTDDAIALGKRSLSLDERNPQAHTLLAQVYAGRRQPREALPHFERAAEIQPKLTQNRLNLAGCLIELRQYARAETILQEIVGSYPKFPLAQFDLGLLREDQGRLEEARAAYAAEVSAYPRHFKARFNLGRVLLRLGDEAGSLAQMREVMALAPDQPEGYLFTARGLLHGDASLDEVQSLAEKGLAVARAADMKALGWFLLADVFDRRRQPEKMQEALRRAESYAPASPAGAAGRPR